MHANTSFKIYGKNSNVDNKKTQAVDTFHKST